MGCYEAIGLQNRWYVTSNCSSIPVVFNPIGSILYKSGKVILKGIGRVGTYIKRDRKFLKRSMANDLGG
jgi:hypothetical protein